MQVKLRSDYGPRSYQGAHTAKQILFAVVITLRDHRAMQIQQHDIYRQYAAEVSKYLLAQRLVRRLDGDARRLCPRIETEDEFVTPGSRLDAPRCGKVQARILESGRASLNQEVFESGRNRRERVGLAGNAGSKNPHVFMVRSPFRSI
jgi:hypothetical protein